MTDDNNGTVIYYFYLNIPTISIKKEEHLCAVNLGTLSATKF